MNQELKYYMNLSYRMEIVEDKDEGGYVLSYPDLPGCMTCSDSLDDLLELAKDARETWILGMLEDEKEIDRFENSGIYHKTKCSRNRTNI